MHATLAGQQQQSLRHSFNMLTNSFKMTNRLEAESLQLSFQYPTEVCTLTMLQDSACWVPQSLINYHKTVWKEVCSDLLSHYKADDESFLTQIITGEEMWTHHYELQTKSQWNGIIHLLLRISLPLLQGKSWPLFFRRQK
jgi:hypothetical protein